MSSTNDVKALLTKFAGAPAAVAEKLKGLSPEQLTYRPFPEAWTIHEQVVHLADSEINSSIRLRKLLAESGAAVEVFDQEKWAKNLNYHGQSLEKVMTVFRLLREIASGLLQGVDERQWDASYVVHPERGKLTLKNWLQIYAEHADTHLEYIERNLRLWKQR